MSGFAIITLHREDLQVPEGLEMNPTDLAELLQASRTSNLFDNLKNLKNKKTVSILIVQARSSKLGMWRPPLWVRLAVEDMFDVSNSHNGQILSTFFLVITRHHGVLTRY